MPTNFVGILITRYFATRVYAYLLVTLADPGAFGAIPKGQRWPTYPPLPQTKAGKHKIKCTINYINVSILYYVLNGLNDKLI